MMAKRLEDNAEAIKALVGRKIVAVDLAQIEDNSGIDPTITLDDGTVLHFEVDDYGSGTYGINFEIERSARRSKP